MRTNASDFFQRLWDDPDLLQEFKSDPKKVLITSGETVPNHAQVFSYIDTNSLKHLVLPADTSSLPEGDNYFINLMRKALQDDDFKNRLINNPSRALKEENLTIAEGITLKVYQNKLNEFHVVLPVNPASDELSDADLSGAAGGGETMTACGDVSMGMTGSCFLASFYTAGAAALVSGVVAGSTAIASVVAD